jgi:membrane protein DedA with SNARE-associated domain
VTHFLFSLPAWLVLAAVALLPALEASAFVGFVFPGETALLVGGVVAAGGHLFVGWVMLAAVLGAIAGDQVGFLVGRRWGWQLLHGSVGRFVKRERMDRTQEALGRMGGKAVFVGRFTVALRVLIPGLAGMSGMRRTTFTGWNVLGALVWAPGVVLIGYLGGHAWKRLAHVASWAGTGVVVVIALGWLLLHLRHRRRERRTHEQAEASRG